MGVMDAVADAAAAASLDAVASLDHSSTLLSEKISSTRFSKKGIRRGIFLMKGKEDVSVSWKQDPDPDTEVQQVQEQEQEARRGLFVTRPPSQ